MNELNVERLGKALSDILSRKYDCKVTITFIPKDEVRAEQLSHHPPGAKEED